MSPEHMSPELNLTNQDKQISQDNPSSAADDGDKILCPHCLRTAKNGIKCKGICVADSDY